MNNSFLVSIVIPVYNGANYLKEAIESALAQTYSNIEILVVNDGSTDGGATEKIAQSYGTKIRYFCKENGGCASALNYAIQQMRGVYFSWLSHDDVYLPDKIEKEIACLNKPNFDVENSVISCGFHVINQDGKKIFRPKREDHGLYYGVELLRRLLYGGAFNGCGLLIPKKVIDCVGLFNNQLTYIPDLEYWLRIALNDFPIYKLKQSLVMTRMHAGQVSVSHKDKLYPELYSVVQKIKKESIDLNVKQLCEEFLYTCGFIDTMCCRSFIRKSILVLRRNKRKFVSKCKQIYWNIVR